MSAVWRGRGCPSVSGQLYFRARSISSRELDLENAAFSRVSLKLNTKTLASHNAACSGSTSASASGDALQKLQASEQLFFRLLRKFRESLSTTYHVQYADEAVATVLRAFDMAYLSIRFCPTYKSQRHHPFFVFAQIHRTCREITDRARHFENFSTHLGWPLPSYASQPSRESLCPEASLAC